MHITLTPCEGVVPRCAMCHDDAVEGMLLCPGCRTLVHPECQFAFACPTLGCARSLRRSQPRDVQLRRALIPDGEPLLSRVLSGLLHALWSLCVLVFGAAFFTEAKMGEGHTARVERTRADMRSMGGALDRYRSDTGAYPARFQSLWERPADRSRWDGPYVQEYPPRDPWGTEYVYSVRSDVTSYEIVSYGADRARGCDCQEADRSSRTINRQEAQ